MLSPTVSTLPIAIGIIGAGKMDSLFPGVAYPVITSLPIPV